MKSEFLVTGNEPDMAIFKNKDVFANSISWAVFFIKMNHINNPKPGQCGSVIEH